MYGVKIHALQWHNINETYIKINNKALVLYLFIVCDKFGMFELRLVQTCRKLTIETCVDKEGPDGPE